MSLNPTVGRTPLDRPDLYVAARLLIFDTPMKRTTRDNSILKTLATKVRFLCLEQAATWWDGRSAQALARRRLRQLANAGFVESSRVRAEPLLELAGPIVTWAPGEPDPPFQAVSNTLRERWPNIQPRQFTIYRATRTTNNRFGGPDFFKPIGADQVTHDMQVASVYLRLLETSPAAADAWLGEDVLGPAGYKLKDPDAVLRYDDGAELAIEFGGRYDAQRIRDLHLDCVHQERPYELW
jgi:hypothetical protein